MQISRFTELLTIAAVCLMSSCGGQGSGSKFGTLPEKPFPNDPVYERGVIRPFDQAPAEPTLVAFIGKLKEAANAKNVDFLLASIRDSTVVSSDGDLGKEKFKQIWSLDSDAGSSEVWTTMHDILEMGGGFYAMGQDFFVAPYYFAAWPGEISTVNHAILVGSDVKMLAESNPGSAAMDSLDYTIVKCDGVRTEQTFGIDGGKYPLYRIERLGQNGTGWVCGKYVRFPVDYRMGLRRQNDEWFITFFVKGL